MTPFDETFINSSKTSQNHCLPSDLTSHSDLLFPLKQGYFVFYFFASFFSPLHLPKMIIFQLYFREEMICTAFFPHASVL